MFHCFAQFIGQALCEKWVSFKDAEEFFGARLTITEDGEGVGVVAEGYASLIDLADAFNRFGEYRAIFPLV